MKINVNEVEKYVKSLGPNTRIYLGADSARYKMKGQWWVIYQFYIHVITCLIT